MEENVNRQEPLVLGKYPPPSTGQTKMIEMMFHGLSNVRPENFYFTKYAWEDVFFSCALLVGIDGGVQLEADGVSVAGGLCALEE